MLSYQGFAVQFYLDGSFGTNGSVIFNPPALTGLTASHAQAIKIDGSGNIVVAGSAVVSDVQKILVARYTTLGLLDTTFNSDGYITTLNGSDVYDQAWGLTFDGTGKVLVVGVGGATVDAGKIVVARYNINGTFDTSFYVDIPTASFAGGVFIAVEGSGNYIIAGNALISGVSKIFVLRCDTSGNVLNYVDTVLPGAESSVLNSAALQSNGNIIVMGTAYIPATGQQFVTLRYNITTDFALDASFNGTGYVIQPILSGSNANVGAGIIQDASGNIAIDGFAGDTLQTFVFMRYTSAGVLDTSFNYPYGYLQYSGTTMSNDVYALAYDQLLDALVLSGSDLGRCLLLRLDATGTLDTTFGSGGAVLQAIGTSCAMRAVTVDSSSRPVVAGESDGNMVVARFLANNTTDVIAITSPVNGSTVTSAFTISGSATEANYTVKLYIDSNLITTTSTDVNGFWNAGSFVATNGVHSMYAELWSGASLIATSATTTITVNLGFDAVTIASPANGATITTNSITILGGSTRSGYTVQVTLDSVVIATATTDSSGQWNAGTWAVSDGLHNIQADLLTTGASVLNGFTVSSSVGPIGPTGYSGVSGVTGSSGYSGLTGLTGVTGLPGDIGMTGITGVSGESGLTGFSGITGRTGTTGTTGQTSISGSTGYSGITGASGLTGTTGLFVTGSTGATGEGGTGVTGATGGGGTGLSGISGETGLTGWSGLTGGSGISGSTGKTGFTGQSGVTGSSGITGLSGLTGLSGITGFTGKSGSTGLSGSTGTSGLTGITGISGLTGVTGATGISPEGNVVRVDAVYGNDATCVRNRWDLPCLTIAQGLSKAQQGDTVWVFPGIYDESGLTLPNGTLGAPVVVRGLSVSNTFIAKTGVTGDTTMVTMGENTLLQDIYISLQSNEHHTLKGLVFPGTTSVTAFTQGIGIMIDNSAASSGGTSNVYGVHSTGTGTDYEGVPSMLSSTVIVSSIGNGAKRALLNDAANSFAAVISNFRTLCPLGSCTGSYMGVEVNNVSAAIQLQQCDIEGPLVDISQTAGSMILDLTKLTSSNANGLIFNTSIQPTLIVWGDNGTLTASSPIYLRPGQNTSSTTINNITLGHHCVVKRLIVHARVAPGAGRTDTFTVMKNGVATTVTCSLTGTAPGGQDASDTTHSVHFDAGDLLAIQVVRSNTSNATADVIATVEVY